MMELSENAAAALENLRESQGVPEDRGTRITAERGKEGGLALRLEFVEEIPESDQVVEQSGTEVHLDEKVAEPLENVVMDVRDTDEGLAFVFRGQTP
ncbi:MAG TPA: iron-sulfur cluster biosynthesis family protein [Acidimicrobiia bacterium]